MRRKGVAGKTAGAPGRVRGRVRSAPCWRIWARMAALAAALPVAVIGTAGPASAHVTITPSTTAAGAHAVLEVSVGHGCEGSPTTEITIRIPDEINSVTPTRTALWQVEKKTVKLDPPLTDTHGSTVTERVASVTYRADDPLPEGYRDAFELSLQLPEVEGTTLVFPTIQTCRQGESAWIEVPEAGQSAEDLELPAPAFTITAAEAGGHHEEAPATETSTGDVVGTSDGSTAAQQSEDGEALALAALGVGLLGALLGGTALVLGRRRR